MKPSPTLEKPVNLPGLKLKTLTPEQVERIDEVLTSIGEYGEVHLIVQRGELRYINKVESYKITNDKLK